jgi:gas vesicle protein
METGNDRKGERTMTVHDGVKGLIVGGVLGAVLGTLCAPKSGKEVRLQLSNSKDELLEKAKMQYEEALKRIEQLAGREKESYSEKKARLKKALEAGVEAFKQEKAASPQA